MNVGEYLSPGTRIVNLQSLDPIDIDFSLPEQYSGRVQAGYKVAVKVDAFPDQVFEGEVIAVEPRIDAATRNFGLRARLPNADLKLRAGLFGNVHLSLPGVREVVALPRTAISYDSYGTSVFIVQPKQAEPVAGSADATAPPAEAEAPALVVSQRFIKLGEVHGDYVAVLEGLKEGEQVATSGLLKLRNQQPVIINNESTLKPELQPTPTEG